MVSGGSSTSSSVTPDLHTHCLRLILPQTGRSRHLRLDVVNCGSDCTYIECSPCAGLLLPAMLLHMACAC
jgi:hypothetical protein